MKKYFKDLRNGFPEQPVFNIDYMSLETRVIKSICDKCPVCGEPIIDIAFFPFPELSLKGHLAKQTDNAHIMLEIMSL